MADTDLDRLWTPFQLGRVWLRNRVFVSGHTTNFAEGTLPTPRHVAYHRARARGGVGLIITEAVRVHPTSLRGDKSLGSYAAGAVEAYGTLVDAVHAEGAAMFAQLTHAGRQVAEHTSRVPAWSSSPVPWMTGAPVPHQMTEADIAVLLDAFDDAVRTSVAAGFDGVEVHIGHGHLLHQFLSPAVNRRDDGYGGSREGRLRLIREVLARVFIAGDDRLEVGIRLSADEFLDDGLGIEDMLEAVAALLAEFPLAFLNVSHSAYVGSYSLATQMADMTFGTAPFRSFPARFKAAFPEVPVMAICRIDDVSVAASFLAAGEADLVGMTRAHIADPTLVAKARQGHHDRIRSCIACNEGCIGRVELGMPITCVVNPSAGLEREWESVTATTPRRSRVLVVGGGPAGLEAAVTARRRGHEVVLAEARDRLGGQVRYAASLEGRSRYALLVDELERDAQILGVRLQLGYPVTTVELGEEGWDAVILATGSHPQVAHLPGGRSLTSTWEALDNPDQLGNRVAVWDEDGGWAGAGLAEHLARQGRDVDLVTARAEIGWRITTYSRLALLPRLGRLGVRVRLLRMPVVFSADDSLVLSDALTGEQEAITDVTAVVHAASPRAEDGLYRAITLSRPAPDVQLVGDAYAPRGCLEAVSEGRLAGVAVGLEDHAVLRSVRDRT